MTTPFPPGSALVAYLRDSGGPGQQLSVPRQEEEIRRWCSDNLYSLVRVFSDVAKPGGTTVGRFALFDLLSFLEHKPDIAGVVVYEYERWSRDFDDSQFYISSIRRSGYGFHSISNPLPDGPVGKVVESLYQYAAEEEKIKLSRRVRSGMLFIVKELHGFPHPTPPIGYRKTPFEVITPSGPRTIQRLEPDPLTAPLVQKAFDLRLAGASLSDIRREVRIFEQTASISRMLRYSIYTGRFKYAGVTIEGYCTPLVDPPTWQAVQDIREAARERTGFRHPRRMNSSYLLSGLARCNRCGAALVGTHSSQYAYYLCQRKPNARQLDTYCDAPTIKKTLLEERVRSRLLEICRKPQVLLDIQDKLRTQDAKKDKDRQDRLTRAQSELDDTDRAIKNLIAAVRDAGHSPNLLVELARLETKHEELRTRLFDLEAQAPLPAKVVDVRQIAQDLAPALEAATSEQLRRLFRQVIVHVRAERQAKRLLGEIAYKLGPVEDILSL